MRFQCGYREKRFSGNWEFGLRVCMGFGMIMINHKWCWKFPDGMINTLIVPWQLSALPSFYSFLLEQFTVVLTLGVVAKKSWVFLFFIFFLYLPFLHLTVASCTGAALPHITPRKHFLPPFHFLRHCYLYWLASCSLTTYQPSHQ